MNKRGQVTVFIIIGILILATVGGLLYLKSKEAKKGIERKGGEIPEAGAVKSLVESCLESTAEEGLFLIGLQGGYYKVKEPFKQFSELATPYYFYLGKENFPRLEEVEKELSIYIKDNLGLCADFKIFEEQGFEFILREISVNSSLEEQAVINLNYPIQIKKGTVVASFEVLSKRLDFDLKEVYEIVEKIVEEQRNDTEAIPISLITNLAAENGFTFSIINTEKEEVFFALFFDNELREEPYQFSFIVRYNWSDLFQKESENELKLSQKKIDDGITRYYLEKTIILLSDGEAGGFDYEALPETWGGEGSWNNPVDLEGLSDDQLLKHLTPEIMLKNPKSFEEFESRLIDPNFAERINSKRELLKAWAEKKGISFGKEGKLEKYERGEIIITKGAGSTRFNPKDVPKNTLVLADGSIEFPSKAQISGATLEQKGKILQIKGGITDLEYVAGELKNIEITGKGEIHVSGYKASSEEKPMTVSVDAQGIPTLKGEKVVISDRTDKKTIYDFKGSVSFYEDHLILGEKTEFTDYGYKEGVTYKTKKATEYYWENSEKNREKLSSIKNAIISDYDEKGIIVKSRDNAIEVEDLGKSIKFFRADQIEAATYRALAKLFPLEDMGTIILTNPGLRIIMEKGGIKFKGNPLLLDTEVFSNYVTYTYDQHRGVSNLKFEPEREEETGAVIKVNIKRIFGRFFTEKGLVEEIEPVGELTEKTIKIMEKMGENAKYQREWVKQLEQKYKIGKETIIQRIILYFNDIREAGLINAIEKASERNSLSFNFLASASFKEGVINHMEVYYKEPSEKLNNFDILGLDRFGKEIEILKEKGYLDRSFKEGQDYEILGERTNIIRKEKKEDMDKIVDKFRKEFGDQFQEEKDYKLYYDRAGGEYSFELPARLAKGGYYASESGELSPLIDFLKLESAYQAFSAAMAWRRDILKETVGEENFRRLSQDQIDYWTYVLYNEGSGPKYGDLFGKGLARIESQIGKNKDISGLSIPLEASRFNALNNAKGVLATKKLLDKANPYTYPKTSPPKKEEKIIVAAK